jgi:hypothetical protein
VAVVPPSVSLLIELAEGSLQARAVPVAIVAKRTHSLRIAISPLVKRSKRETNWLSTLVLFREDHWLPAK